MNYIFGYDRDQIRKYEEMDSEVVDGVNILFF